MGLVGDSGGGGPYSSESVQNTSTDWLDDFKPVEAKLDGMVDYGKALTTIQMNLMGHRMRIVQQINALVSDGAFEGGFPEVSYAQQLHNQNFGEFNQYLQNLYDGLDHTANAAKAIADSYGEQDGFSSISLNAIQFAFADPNATRPAGLPKEFGQTFSDQAAAALAKPGNQGRPAPIWVSTATTMNPDGGMTQTYQDQYGETQTITIAYDANGHQITTTTGPSGTTTSDSSTVSFPYGTYTTTTNTGADGKVSTSTSETVDVDGTSTTDDLENGVTKSETVVTYNADGSETTTVYAVNDGKKTVASQVSVGGDNYVDNGEPDSPAQDAIQSIQSSMPKPSGPKTQILAPGEPGVDYSGGGSSGGTSV